MNKVLALALFILLTALEPVTAGLAGRIEQILARSDQRNVEYSISIADAQTGQVLYSHNPQQAMIPASNMKLITSAAAIFYLGMDYEYVTRVGLWDDKLVIIGSGDPLLGDDLTDRRHERISGWVLLDIIEKLREKGVTQISDIIVDSTIFDDQRVHPNWPADQLNRWYACEISGVNYQGNCIDVTATNIAGRVNVQIRPDTNYVRIRNDVRAVSSGDQAVGSYRTATPNSIIVFGRCRTSQGPFKVAIERPAAFFGFLVFEQLAQNDIEVTGQLIEKAVHPGEDFVEIARYSTAMADVLARCNQDSLGLAAEALVKTIAANADGPGGSWERGTELMGQYLAWLGVDPQQYNIDEGSGLSRENRLSSYAIKRALLHMRNSGSWDEFKESLAVGGQSGTLSRHFRSRPYLGNVIGKTGYIRAVHTFSGVCKVNGDEYIVSALANRSNGMTRTALNDIAKAVIDEFAN